MTKIPRELVEKYMSDEEITDAVATLGVNRDQYFVRIPVKISERLNLKKTDKIKFIVRGKGESVKLETEVIRNAEA